MKYYSIYEKEPPRDEMVLGYDCYYDGWTICIYKDWCKSLIVYPNRDDCFITHWAKLKIPSEPTNEEIKKVTNRDD